MAKPVTGEMLMTAREAAIMVGKALYPTLHAVLEHLYKVASEGGIAAHVSVGTGIADQLAKELTALGYLVEKPADMQDRKGLYAVLCVDWQLARDQFIEGERSRLGRAGEYKYLRNPRLDDDDIDFDGDH